MSASQNSATAFAPATVANVAVGFDILGFAVDGVGDSVTVTKTKTESVVIEEVTGVTQKIPTDPLKNTAGLPLVKMIEDLHPGFGFSVKIKKGIPLGSGMGGSAASAVGAVVAANALLKNPLSKEKLIRYALEGEAVASGLKHADNIAPCLYGGLTLSRPGDDPDVNQLPFPKTLHCVLVNPLFQLNTKDARAILKPDLLLKTHIHQSASLAAFIAGCCTSNIELIRKGLVDIVIEPQRAQLIPGFYEVKQAALSQGALGCSISGAGPTVFALTQDAATAAKVKDAMINAFQKSAKLTAQGWISSISSKGAHTS